MEHSAIPLPEAGHSQAGAPLSFHVIIPAHNEAAVIARCLTAALEDPQAMQNARIVVVANACTDQTAAIARSFGPQVEVIETPVASKALAINLGIAQAPAQPCLVLDADVVCKSATLLATARELTGDSVQAASPRLDIRYDRANALVRSYYKVWQSLPYAQDRLLGGGIYGLSAQAVSEILPLPDVIADDLYIRAHVPFARRRTVTHSDDGTAVAVVMYPPETALDLVAIEARRRRGTMQVKRALRGVTAVAHNGSGSWARSLGNGCGLVDLFIYLGIKALGRILASVQLFTGRHGWSRDLSTRGHS